MSHYSYEELTSFMNKAQATLDEIKRLDLERYSQGKVESLNSCKARIQAELAFRSLGNAVLRFWQMTLPRTIPSADINHAVETYTV